VLVSKRFDVTEPTICCQGTNLVSTIRDVAKRAGVAISTVSAVINRSAPTSAAVVASVERAIAEIGYTPQRAAQTLRSGRSRLIGVIVPDITNPHFSALARVVENECLKAGYMTFVYNTDEDTDHEMRILRMMRMQRAAGLILISTRSDAQHGRRLMAEIHVPTVLMGSSVAGTPYDFVALDDVEAGVMATRRLLDLGHRRIAVIGGREGVSSHELRLKGCRIAFQERGLALAADQVCLAQFTSEKAYEETRRRMTAPSPPTAVVSLSNFMTIGVMRALADLKLRCPEETSFIGIDDLDWADIMHPRPTLIAQPIEDMTRTAIGTLLEQVSTATQPSGRQLLFPPRLVERKSCARPKTLASVPE
jgi:DNA-binding LacI/PurR family transcriptional regulator